jgi:hypothetical protein
VRTAGTSPCHRSSNEPLQRTGPASRVRPILPGMMSSVFPSGRRQPAAELHR